MATKIRHDWSKLDPLIDNLKAQGWNDTQIARDLGLGRQTLVDHLRTREPGTPTGHPSTPVHSGIPQEHRELSTSAHPDTPEDTDPSVRQGTLEAHQEVMEDISQSVPDAPHIGIKGADQEIPEYPSTPIVHPEVSPNDSSPVFPGQPRLDAADIAPETAHTVMDDALSAIADMLPAIEGAINALSPDETDALERCERIIAEGIQTFLEVGRALLVIRDEQLYRATHATFEAYCRERWDLSRTYAYQLIGASEVVDHVSAVSDVVPANEAQVRPLVSLPPELQVEVWQEAVDTAPPSGITAAHVKRTVARVKGQPSVPKPHAPESKRPARMVVQEGLVWGLHEVEDEDVWEILAWLWDGLNHLAPKYTSLRGMLDRIKRQFPEGHRTLIKEKNT